MSDPRAPRRCNRAQALGHHKPGEQDAARTDPVMPVAVPLQATIFSLFGFSLQIGLQLLKAWQAAIGGGGEGFAAVEELLLALADLDGVDLIRLGQFSHGPGLHGGLQGDLGLERGRMPLACTSHKAPRDESETIDQSNIPS
jgi:hypothetical protein